MKTFSILLSMAACGLAHAVPFEGALAKGLAGADYSTLQARAAYEVGVNIFSQANCNGNNVAFRNHDEHSCNAASTTTDTNWITLKGKVGDGGTSNGKGCLTIFSDTACTANSVVYTLNGDANCITPDYAPQCVVVSSTPSSGVCVALGPDC